MQQDASAKPIRVAVCGAKGKMGREVVKTVAEDAGLALAGVVSRTSESAPVSDVFGIFTDAEVLFDTDLSEMLKREKPDVCVDFTNPDVVYANTMAMIEAGVRPVIGTTGLTPEQLTEIDQKLKQKGLGGMVVPNIAIGAVLKMKFAQEASKYFDHAEIIELHHNKKADAPSGTALKTAELMRQSRVQFGTTNSPETEIIQGARGAADPANIHIHSVRLPGYIAHQEVLFGSPGQVLSIRHDSMDRACFMPGVALAVKRTMTLTGLVYGLEHIL